LLQHLEPYSDDVETTDSGTHTALEAGSTMDVEMVPDYFYTIEALGVSGEPNSCTVEINQDYDHLVVAYVMGPYDNTNSGYNCAILVGNVELYEFDDPVNLVISDGVNSWTAVISAAPRIYDDFGYAIEQWDDLFSEEEVTIQPVG